MELDPDLQFKHYTVAEAQLPAESLARMSQVSLGDARDLLRPRAPRLQSASTRIWTSPRPDAARTGSTSASGRPSGPGADTPPRRSLTTLRRVPAIVIPYRGDTKRRVSSPLPAPALAVAMLGDVVEAALAVGRVPRRHGRPRGCSSRTPRSWPIRDEDSAAAVGAGSVAHRRSRARRQRRSSLLPRLRPCFVPRGRGTRARRGEGRHDERAVPPRPTRLLAAVRPWQRRSAFARTLPSPTASIPELEVDVDSDTDLERALAGRLGPRTRALLAVHA